MKNNLLIKGGRVLDPASGYHFDRKDIYIEDGVIKEIRADIDPISIEETIFLNDHIITPGFIDAHVHVYTDRTSLGIDADRVGVQNGCTTLFDAGSAGVNNFKDFHKNVIEKSETAVFSLLNIGSLGLEQERYELSSMKNIDINAVKETVKNNRQYIKGIKARASASTLGELGIKPIEEAKKVVSDLKLPLVVHIGNEPPKITDILDLMEKGDVITHCFHGKKNGLLDDNGNLRKETIEAIDRGVLFDIGHGTSSFNFNTAMKAMSQGLYPHIISTDIYLHNYRGPVYGLGMTINKMLAIGLSLEECISRVTTNPSSVFRLEELGAIKKGYAEDLTIFQLKSSEILLTDSDGNCLNHNNYIKVNFTIKGGKKFDVCNRDEEVVYGDTRGFKN